MSGCLSFIVAGITALLTVIFLFSNIFGWGEFVSLGGGVVVFFIAFMCMNKLTNLGKRCEYCGGKLDFSVSNCIECKKPTTESVKSCIESLKSRNPRSCPFCGTYIIPKYDSLAGKFVYEICCPEFDLAHH
jgi:DNA-directed RNA polymerase subunit RPC12/RpoP